jgi:hypothetical protein
MLPLVLLSPKENVRTLIKVLETLVILLFNKRKRTIYSVPKIQNLLEMKLLGLLLLVGQQVEEH